MLYLEIDNYIGASVVSKVSPICMKTLKDYCEDFGYDYRTAVFVGSVFDALSALPIMDKFIARHPDVKYDHAHYVPFGGLYYIFVIYREISI